MGMVGVGDNLCFSTFSFQSTLAKFPQKLNKKKQQRDAQFAIRRDEKFPRGHECLHSIEIQMNPSMESQPLADDGIGWRTAQWRDERKPQNWVGKVSFVDEDHQQHPSPNTFMAAANRSVIRSQLERKRNFPRHVTI